MSKELMKQNIEKAQREIDSKKDIVKKGKMRQRYHFMAQTGWLNDPNGLIYFRGKYHFFFQHNPYNGFWDSMHWGHAVSDDMLHWEYLPLALAPSETYDNHLRGGCFSGSAIEHDGKLFLMFTGATNEGKGNEQTQCIAYSEDGIHFEKYAGNPVLTAPEGVPTDCFRDPKVWKHEDTYYMVCGASRDNKGQALLYRSKDMIHWTYFNVLAESRGEWGYMWECPDFFPLGDKHVLICSPQNMKAEKYEFHNGNNSVYFLGNYDKNSHIFEKEEPHTIDYGLDFYAPQTTLLPDGRRVMIAWMKSWDACVVPDTQDWQGMMTLPRELEVKDGQIWQQPVRELAQYHKNPCHYEHAEIDGGTALSGICGRTMDLTITMDEQDFNVFSIQLAADEEYETSFTYHKGTGILEIDRTYCGVTKDVVCVRKIKIADPKGLKKMRFILDRQSIELFINDGQQVATTAVCTPLEAEGIRFFSDKKMYITVEKYDIVL